MSIVRCYGCERTIDLDFDDAEDVRIGEDMEIMCPGCAENYERRLLEGGRQLAAEHGRDLAEAREALGARQSVIDAGRGHLLNPDDGVTCPRCKQKMADKNEAEGCRDPACPLQ